MFVISNYWNDCISSKYRQYCTAGIETESKVQVSNIENSSYRDTFNACSISQSLSATVSCDVREDNSQVHGAA